MVQTPKPKGTTAMRKRREVDIVKERDGSEKREEKVGTTKITHDPVVVKKIPSFPDESDKEGGFIMPYWVDEPDDLPDITSSENLSDSEQEEHGNDLAPK